MRKRALHACFVAAGVLALAACSDDSTGDSATTVLPVSATDETGAAVTTTSAVADVTDVQHSPGSGDFVGALADVTEQTCDQQADGWRVTGRATNPTAAAVDYRIYVSLLDGASATRALVETNLLAVAPSSVGIFDVLIPIPDNDLRCVLRVERRPPGN
jgi:hypothetical protein